VTQRLRLETTMSPAISNLFRLSGPPAVAGLVVAIGVDSVDGVAWAGTSPHICEERGEVVAPSIADRDAAPAIVRVASGPRVSASRQHARPRVVFGGNPVESGVSVTAPPLADDVSFQAATRARSTSQELTSSRCDGGAARTKAVPAAVAMLSGWRLRQHREAFKSASSKIVARSRHSSDSSLRRSQTMST
jgi:hypothetical protein